MDRRKIQLTVGQKFGMLSYLGEAGRKRLPSGQYNRMVLMKCDCGREKEVRLLHVIRLRITNCGCVVPRHGMTKTKLYRVWTGMHVRCYTDTCIDHHRYKDRGITMCDEWKNSFLTFRDWALSNGYQEGLKIDRKNNDKGYNPDNCRFVTHIENMANRGVTHIIEYNGEKTPFTKVLSEKGMTEKYHQIRARIKRGWSAQKAIDTPMRKGNYRRKNAVPAN